MKLTLLVAGLASTAWGAAVLNSRAVLHEKRSEIRGKWKRGARIEADAILPVRIGLTQNNLDDGYAHLMDVSHPDSPNFGKHWTKEQVHHLFAPAEHATTAVKEWLVASGVKSEHIVHSENKGWLAFDIPASLAEQLFHAEYYEHEHADSGKLRVGCDEYHLPSHIKEHVDYVLPGVKLSHPLKKRNVKRSSPPWHKFPFPPFPGPGHQKPHFFPPPPHPNMPTDLQHCDVNITPPCIKALYQIPNANPFTSGPINSVGIYEDGDIYSQQDINLFFQNYAPYVPQNTHPIPAFIDGAQAPVPPQSTLNTGESDIDIDIITSLVYPQTITLYQTDDLVYESENEYPGFLNNWLDALDGSYCKYTAYGITGNSPGIDAPYPDPQPGGYKGPTQCGVYNPTRVISVSYGEAEADLPINYLKRQCNEFMKLGLSGHTILFASGDYGVASFPDDPSPNGCIGADHTIYNPSNPGVCPFITSVGATRLYAGQTVNSPESALQANLGPGAELFASGGGFSNYFPIPDYQKSAVATYFAEHDPGLPYYESVNGSNIGANGGVYNRIGRGIPDVSANGAELLAYDNLTLYHWYGTSLAAPIWAGVVTLINEERTAIGKGAVGFLNPTLYSNPGVLIDIKNGSNPGCGSSGFKAVEGWDPITGLGTPSYPKLSALLVGLP